VTATLPTSSPTRTGDDERCAALARVHTVITRGARSYLDWHDLDATHDAQGGIVRLEGLASLDDAIGHVAGIVQAAAREVVARGAAELTMFARDREALRNVRFARVADRDALELLEQVGPCFLVAADDSAELWLPAAGCAAEVSATGAQIDMSRVARFILGQDEPL
jgi:hypothetical protein